MKETPEKYSISVLDPLTEKDIEFTLEDDFNVDLIVRLIRKREHLRKSSRDFLKRVQAYRKDNDIEEIEKNISNKSVELQSLSEDDFDSKKEYNKAYKKLENEVFKLRDAYTEFAELAQKLANIQYKGEDVGISICKKLLKPKDGVPPEYRDKNEFIEDIIFEYESQEAVISFFLNQYSSYMTSQKEAKPTVKIQKMK